MKRQSTNSILMVRPAEFDYNAETAVNNYYQKAPETGEREGIRERAQREFDGVVEILSKKGIRVIAVDSILGAGTPDAVFPNNWITTHQDGRVTLYSMFAENRRRERRMDIVQKLAEEGYEVGDVIDYTAGEAEGRFLEGTGVMILDRVNRRVYCSLSERASEEVLGRFGEEFDYTPVKFTSYQSVGGKRMPIYHTNVMMALGSHMAVICLDSIDDEKERVHVVATLTGDGKRIVEITEDQVENFAGNMLEVEDEAGKLYLVMSRSAYDSLRREQIEAIERSNEIITVEIPTIEKYGGGSIRCMMAEVFLPRKEKKELLNIAAR